MKRGLHDGHTVVLQHVEKSRLSGIVETEEEELGVLVKQTKRREDVVNCSSNLGSAFLDSAHVEMFPRPAEEGMHTPVDNPHGSGFLWYSDVC